ncbi:MAG: gluconolaconase [Pyrinomonadaceae bacterium]|nr:gluconolaconase [Pyrinomonadaceae bacterium]
MNEAGRIVRIDPAATIPGGVVNVECENFNAQQSGSCAVYFNDERGWIVAASSRRVMASVPEVSGNPNAQVTLAAADAPRSQPQNLTVGVKLAEDLHMVANPAFDPEDGSLYVTRSGSRGQRMPISLLRLSSDGELSPFSGEIVNPTGIAFDTSGQMYVTSRLDETVYRVTTFDEAAPFARDLGVATGLAFDRQGRMYVGDRQGTIHRINGIGEAEEWAQLEPSVSAYHLAFGADGALYVTGPTVSSFDAVMRIDEDGDTNVFYRGLGRPQGLAFDRDGNLYVAASLRGRRGIVRISPDGSKAELAVAGMNVVGLAFSNKGEMIVATNDTIYSLPLGIQGALLS